MGIVNRLKRLLIDPSVEAAIENMPKQTTSLGFDPWGYNSESAKLSMSLVKPYFDTYFRVKTHGLENVPKEGRVLIISNHSGIIPIDAALLSYAVTTSEVNPRVARAMMERFLPMVPWIGNLLNEVGAVVGDPLNCGKMLEREEAIFVFPEGVRGTGKAFKDRYELQRFGNGFMHLAIDYDTPILPVGIVGCEEILPSLGNIDWLAKMANIPYVPVAFPLPIPSQVVINIGEPLYFDKSAETEDEITENVEQVKDVIRALIKKGLDEKDGAIL